jgi:ParB-like chromosome segregation protein Spo0J
MEAIKVSVDTLKEFPGNPRKGNVKKLAESLTTNGQYKPIVVQKSTQQILAGNHLWKAAKELGWTEINVVEIDVNDEQAKKIVAADNRLGELGTYDEQALLDLLEEINLEGTGYEPADVDDLLAFLEEKVAVDWKTGNTLEGQQENVQHRPTLSERAEHYAERTIRLLMCEYPNAQYVWIIEKLTALREQYGVESNADAIRKLVENATGENSPS